MDNMYNTKLSANHCYKVSLKSDQMFLINSPNKFSDGWTDGQTDRRCGRLFVSGDTESNPSFLLIQI